MDVLTQVTFNQIQGLIELYNFFDKLIKEHRDEDDNDMIQDKIRTFCKEELSYLDTNVYTTNEMGICLTLNVDLYINGVFKYNGKECNTNLVYNHFRVLTINNKSKLTYSYTLLYDLLKAITLQLNNAINVFDSNYAINSYLCFNTNDLRWYYDGLKVLIKDANTFKYYLNFIKQAKPKNCLDFIYKVLRDKITYKTRLEREQDYIFLKMDKVSKPFQIRAKEDDNNEQFLNDVSDVYEGMLNIIKNQLDTVHDMCLSIDTFK